MMTYDLAPPSRSPRPSSTFGIVSPRPSSPAFVYFRPRSECISRARVLYTDRITSCELSVFINLIEIYKYTMDLVQTRFYSREYTQHMILPFSLLLSLQRVGLWPLVVRQYSHKVHFPWPKIIFKLIYCVFNMYLDIAV